MFNFLICDDHVLITNSVEQILKASNFLCDITITNTRDDLLDAIRQKQFDVIFLDLNVHGYDMIKEIDQISLLQRKAGIIILTVYDSIPILEDVIKKGIHGFLNKNVGADEILDCVSNVLGGKKYISREHRKNQTFKDNFELLNVLTEREVEVLKQLTKGFTNKRIATELNISINTVQTHRKNLYSKLQLRGVNELVAFAFENNLYD